MPDKSSKKGIDKSTLHQKSTSVHVDTTINFLSRNPEGNLISNERSIYSTSQIILIDDKPPIKLDDSDLNQETL